MEQNTALREFEAATLMSLIKLHPNAYGVTIREDISSFFERDVSIGTVYSTLSRLEVRGFVSCWIGESTPERGGRAKKYFKIEALGEIALRHYKNTMKKFWERPKLGAVLC